MLMMKSVFHMPNRGTEGFVGSIFAMLGVELPVPDPVPFKLMLTSTVMLLARSRKKTFSKAGNFEGREFVPPSATRLLAELAKRM